MEKIKVLIVEDHLLVAEDISTKLKKHSLDVMGMFTSGEEAIDFVESHVPDLILMDIQLAGKLDGIATAIKIQSKHDIPIIYLSDYTDSDTINRAKETTPANYLAKPFLETDLIRAIDFAFHNSSIKKKNNSTLLKEHIFVRENQAFVKIPIQDIQYLEAERSYCNIVCINKTYMLSKAMSHIYEQIESPEFVKIHRSHIINVNKIESIEGNVVRIGTHEIQMSKEYRDDLLNKLKFVK
jgi:DNA-binding LytR/AlgR family response regulator